MNRPEMLNRKQDDGRGLIFFLGLVVIVLLLFLWADLRMTETYYIVEVVGKSMQNTLESGDVVYAERNFTVARGDIVIIDVSENEAFEDAAHKKGDKIIKRVIALEGDSVMCEQGVVYVKSEGGVYRQLEETYAIGTTPFDYFPEVTLGEGEVFVLGDNRPVSLDSRSFGSVGEEDIVGKVPAWSVEARETIKKWESFRSGLANLFTE